MILTVQTTPTHRTLQASADDWESVLAALRNVRETQLAAAVATLLAGRDGPAVRVTLPVHDATRVLEEAP